MQPGVSSLPLEVAVEPGILEPAQLQKLDSRRGRLGLLRCLGRTQQDQYVLGLPLHLPILLCSRQRLPWMRVDI